MPTYSYVCEKCKEEIEIIHSIKKEPYKKHNEINNNKCDGKLRRIIGKGSHIVFKGTGFYETDYKNKEKEKTK